jgi:hypothetical protein
MKPLRTLTFFLALAVSSVASAEKPKEAPPAGKPQTMTKAEVAKAKKFLHELADTVVKNQNDCPKMATGINAVLDKNEAFLAQMMASKKDLPQKDKDELKKRQGDMMNGFMKCKDDKAVVASMQRIAAISSKNQGEAPPPVQK